MAAETSTRGFDPSLDTDIPTIPAKDEVESPSLSSSSALARFEFESGRKNDGTKVLLVEWEDDESTRHTQGEWHISWKDRESVLPADDHKHNDIHRLYFLLPQGTPVPPQVTLTHVPADSSQQPVKWKTNPLPAIFPPELGATARAAGKKGVLHTLWAKRRLQSLQAEIEAESKSNVEGIGLEIALHEKQWIEDNFGVIAKASSAKALSEDASGRPLSPTTPRTPGAGRFLEKMAGLKLETSERDPTTASDGPEMPPLTSPPSLLSPEAGDVAVSSFASIKGVDPTRSPVHPAHGTQRQQTKPAVSLHTQSPSFLSRSQQGSMTSLAGVLSGATTGSKVDDNDDEDDKDEDLFALPMSPRSPDSTKGPFSSDAKNVQQPR